nr:MAG TPA: hypothetical protein [Caudoviricetes sp.]
MLILCIGIRLYLQLFKNYPTLIVVFENNSQYTRP